MTRALTFNDERPNCFFHLAQILQQEPAPTLTPPHRPPFRQVHRQQLRPPHQPSLRQTHRTSHQAAQVEILSIRSRGSTSTILRFTSCIQCRRFTKGSPAHHALLSHLQFQRQIGSPARSPRPRTSIGIFLFINSLHPALKDHLPATCPPLTCWLAVIKYGPRASPRNNGTTSFRTTQRPSGS